MGFVEIRNPVERGAEVKEEDKREEEERILLFADMI
jgi:hypothetical protein